MQAPLNTQEKSSVGPGVTDELRVDHPEAPEDQIWGHFHSRSYSQEGEMVNQHACGDSSQS